MPAPFFYEISADAHAFPGADYTQRIAELNREVVQTLHQVGEGILLGSDAAQAHNIPGFSIHDELVLLVEAGPNPYRALQAGRRNAAQVLGHFDGFGRVAEGTRADLLLLDANPLWEVTNASKISGVMVTGRWLPEDELHSTLDGLKDSLEPSVLERLWPLALCLLTAFVAIRAFRRNLP